MTLFLRGIRRVAAAAVLSLAAVSLCAMPVPALSQSKDQGIVAVANDQPITGRDVTQRIALLTILGDLPPSGMTRSQALQSLVDDQVKLVEAKRVVMMPTDADISDRIDRVAQGMKLSRAELLAKLKAQGISEASFRSYLLASTAFSRIIAAKYRQDVQVSEAEIDAKIAEIKSRVDSQMSKIMAETRGKSISVYSLMEITLPADGNDSMLLQSRAIEAEQVAKRLSGCDSLKAASEGIFNVKAGKKFDADAAKLPPKMKEALDAAGEGRAVGPMRGKDGIQLIALCGVRKITPPKPDFKMPTREQVQRMLVSEKYGKLEQDYLALARDKVYVEYRDPSYAPK